MIRNISVGLLGILFSVLAMGTAVGWLITEDLAGDEVGAAFLKFSSIFALIIFLIQSLIYILAGRRVFYQLIFLTSAAFSIMWFMMGFFIPLFWIERVGVEFRMSTAALLIFLSVSNILEAANNFNKKWAARAKPERYIMPGKDECEKIIDWDGLVKTLKLSHDPYIPGVSQGAAGVIFSLMVVLIILGFFLRSIYPTISAFAVGVPFAIIGTYFFQIIGINVAQAKKIRLLERKFNVKFRSKPIST